MNRLLLFSFLILSSFSLSAQVFQADFRVDTTYGCGPVTVHFTDMSTSPLPVLQRQWNFGDGTYSADESPVHTYNQPGRYQVGYYIMNSSGMYSEVSPGLESQTIKVYPILNPRYHQYQLCSDSILLKSNTVPLPDNMQTYLWSNGKTTPDIKVKSAGTYTVNVTGCGKTVTDNIIVASGTASLAPSTIPLRWDMDTAYIQMVLNVPYPPNAYNRVSWTWGDSSTGNWYNSISESHRYTKTGNVNITASVTLNSDISLSCVDTMGSYNLNIREPYVHHNDWNKHDTSLLQGHVLRIFDTKNPGAELFWYGDNSNNTSSDNGLAITSPGTYYVRILKDGDFTMDVIHVILDTTSLHARISVDGKNCNSISFTDSSFSDISRINYAEWSFGDGSIDTSRNYELTHTYAKDSTYTVRLIVKNEIGMRDTAYQIITINAKPQVDLLKDTTVLQGTNLLLKNLLPAAGNYTYKWSTGATTPAIYVTAQNRYTLSATFCGTTVSDSVYIRMVDTPRVNFTYEPTPIVCSPYHFTFTDITAASPFDSIISYSWNFGNQTTANTKIASTDYIPGYNYNVELTVITSSGFTNTISKPIYVLHNWYVIADLINIAAGPSCSDSAHVRAYVTVPNNAKYTIAWSNGSSKSTTTFDRAGQYFVYLKDSCGNIRAGDTIDIEMNDPLTVSVLQVKDTLSGSLSKYTATPDPAYTWRWYRNDTLLNGQTLSYIIPVISGIYKAMVSSSLGCTVVSVPVTYTAASQPQPKVVRYTYNISPCNSQLYSFKGSVSGIDSIADYKWIIDSQTQPGTDLTYELTPGTHLVTFSVRDIHGDTTNWTNQIAVLAKLPWTASIVNETVTCADTAKLTANSSSAAGGYVWSTGDTTRTLLVTTSGKYYLLVKDSCNTVRAMDSIELVIHAQPYAIMQLATGNTGDTLIVSEGSYYRWYINNVLMPDAHQQMLIPTASGSYTATIINQIGCGKTTAPFIYTLPVQDTVTTEVGTPTDSTLRVAATFNHNFNADNIFTAELMLDNSGGRTTGLQPNEVISLGSVNSSNGNITMDVNIPDSLACANNYIIRITASSPKDTTIWSEQFSINNQPAQPVITQRGDSLFTSGIYNWQWYKNNVAIDGATNANYRARANASYTVEAKNGEGCNTKSSPVAVVITAVGEVTLGGNIAKVFPNPSEGQVYLQFSKPLLKAVTIKVYDLHGKVYYSRTTQQQLQQLDLGNLPKGFYMIELSGYGTQKVLTIVLQ